LREQPLCETKLIDTNQFANHSIILLSHLFSRNSRKVIRSLAKFIFLFICGLFNNKPMKVMSIIISFFIGRIGDTTSISEAINDGIADAFKQMGYQLKDESNR
jgi:hypothetical protein